MPRIIISEPGKSPQPYRFKLEREETNIGRGPDNDIIIEAGSASTRHCIMKRVNGGFILEDLGSTNGLKVNDTRFEVIDLVDEMVVHIGDDVELNFTLTDEELDTLDDEEFTPHERLQLPKKKAAPKQTVEDDDDDFFEDDEEEEAPAPKRRKARPAAQPVAPRVAPMPVKSSGGSSTLLFLLLALGALALGMYIRHYQDVISADKNAPTEKEGKPNKSKATSSDPAE